MLKLIAIGLWVAGVTATAAYVSAGYMAEGPHQSAGQEDYKGLEQLKTEMTSVPMIRGGVITGYVVIQLTFAADIGKLEELKLEPQPFLVDAAFRAIYDSPETNFAKLKPADIDKLTAKIAAEANQRIGTELVKHVLIQQLNYVRKEDIRTNWIKEPAPHE
jgi:hypothetical protein